MELVEEYMVKGRVAIVTGGGRGIGFAIVRQLGRAGARVAVADIRADLAEQAVGRLAEESIEAIAVQADVSSSKSVQKMVHQVIGCFGTVDILVNNAGVGPTNPFDSVTEEQWDRTLDINLKSMFLCSQAVYPIMKKQSKGVILNLASMAGRTGGRASSVDYVTSKHGVVGITRSMAMHLGKDGIRANALAPGIIETEMTAAWEPGKKESFLQNIPIGRLGTPEDVAKVALFLCSDAASYLTGVTLDVTGGLVMS